MAKSTQDKFKAQNNEDSFNFNIVVGKDPKEATGGLLDERKQDLDELLNELEDDGDLKGSTMPFTKSITHV